MGIASQKQVWIVSDLHVDYSENMNWLREICESARPAAEEDRDAMIVAGDLSHNLEHIENALSFICGAFSPVFFVPGNHDLWVRRETGNNPDISSVARFEKLIRLCKKLGIHTTPHVLETAAGWIRILPLFSWYRSDFGRATGGSALSEGHAMDDHYCVWPVADGNPADYFAELNRRPISSLPDDGVPLVTFSHFLPRTELLPPADSRAFTEIAGASGDPMIEAQLRKCGTRIHVYGHTHGRVDRCLDGIRYLQNGIGYPIERGNRFKPSLCALPLEELRSSARPLDITLHYPI